jgi:DNA modification methylase
MRNIETLKALAERAGFTLTENKSSHSPADQTQAALPFEGETGGRYSVCVAAPAFDPAERYRAFNARAGADGDAVEAYARRLRAAAQSLDANGLMFIYGLPRDLARYAVALSNDLAFRYWIAVRAATAQKAGGLRPEHTGLLLMSKPGAALNRLRIPHALCRHCGETLKDWGGKSHLMHPDGVALSDVWMDMVVDPADRLPAEVFQRALDLSSSRDRTTLLLLAPDSPRPQGGVTYHQHSDLAAFNPLDWRGRRARPARAIPPELMNKVLKAPCLDALKAVPSETVDLAFADPPFNLTKNYNGYGDNRAEGDYTGWCKRWLVEYERVLKPGGSMFILNLPRWSVWLADFLTRTGRLYLQNWIVWNSLPEPKGVLMPAHYSLLYFTKGERAACFNYCSMENGWEPFDEAVFPPDRPDVCRRRPCVRKRRASGKTWRGELTDTWHDIHRERRPIKGAVRKKAHPCETPERLIDRIVRLATNPGDVVLDAFAGTGTTAFVARRLNRRFVAIEQDDDYAEVAGRRLSEQLSSWQRARGRPRGGAVSKRALQLELRQLAVRLGRLPTKRDVEALSKYALEVFEAAFSSWGAALKAAKVVRGDSPGVAFAPEPAEQLEIFKGAESARGQQERAGECSSGARAPEEFPINDGGFASSSGVTLVTDEGEAAGYQIS